MRMILSKPLFAALLILLLFEKYSEGSDLSSSNNDETASIPVIASGKRQHNIMRFGKRPAGGHNLMHFGKRVGPKPPQHSFLSFGKRMDDGGALPDLFQYLQRARDNSYKRGHTIMRFGKRTPSSHNFITFGRGEGDEDYEDGLDDGGMDASKRGGHNMLSFGKRGGHSMLYFGKRAAGHKIMSFGKRDIDDGEQSLTPFGENEDGYDESADKRAQVEREFDDEPIPYWNPNTYEKKQHNLLRFGKKMDGSRKGSHSMIHFGKRSVDQNTDSAPQNQSTNTPNQSITRMKREVEDPVENVQPLVALIRYGNKEESESSPEEIILKPPEMYHSPENMNDFMFPADDPSPLFPYSDYLPAYKKDTSKNVFLRFG